MSSSGGQRAAIITDPVLPFSLIATNGRFRLVSQEAPAAITTLYTVPAGKKALFLAHSFYNGDSVSRNHDVWMVPSGGAAGDTNLFYKDSVAVGASSLANDQGPVLLAPGDFIRVATEVGIAAAAKFHLFLLEFDSTVPLVGARVNLPDQVEAVVYTCPAGKSASLLPIVAATWYGWHFRTAVSTELILRKSGDATSRILRVMGADTSGGTAGIGMVALEAGDSVRARAAAAPNTSHNLWFLLNELDL